MVDDIFRQLFDKLQDDGNSRQVSEYIHNHRETLLGDRDNVIALLNRLQTCEGGDLKQMGLLTEIILDEARVDAENGGRSGSVFLQAVSEELSTMDLNLVQVSLLVGSYARARVDVPEQLIDKRVSLMEMEREGRSDTPPDLAKMLKQVIKEADGDVYGVYEALNEMTAGFPQETQSAFVYEISSIKNPESWHLAAFWLLSAQVDIRQEVALALLHRIQNGESNADLIRQLPALRNWMIPDGARALVDKVIREARLKQLDPAVPRPALKINKVLTTFPDGVGAQSIALVSKKKIGMVLLKDGFGIKDAFVIECKNAREVKEICANMYEMDAQEIETDLVDILLSGALANGHENGHCPAHGLLDVASQFGLEGLRPQEFTPEKWLSLLDDRDEFSALTVQKQARIIKKVDILFQRFPLLESWFEDNQTIRDVLNGTAASRWEKKVADYLDGRRGYWAVKMLQTALILKKAMQDEALWYPLSISAYTLLQGRDIRKIPLMYYVLDNTIEAFEYSEAQVSLDEEEADMMSAPSPMDIDPAQIYEAVGMQDPSWIDGYLTAVLISPEMISPQVWAEHLMENIKTPLDYEILNSFLQLAVVRYNTLNNQMLEGAPCLDIAAASPNGLHPWADGFLESVNVVVKKFWEKRNLEKDDQENLSLIEKISQGGKETPEVADRLESWISTRVEKRA